MKPIGQFAKENKVTVKTLHHYEKVGLITPSKVDPENGYRYYNDADALDLRIVLFMKDLGFSLSEIKDIMKNQYVGTSLIDFVSFKYKQAENDLETTSNRLFKLKTVIDVLQSNQEKFKFKELIGMSEKVLNTDKYGRGKYTEDAVKIFNKAKLENTPLTFMELDLDHFHEVNVTHGYEVGDVVIQRTADEIVSVLQETKYTSIMERKGGDEFSILIGCTPRQAAKVATSILNHVIAIDYSDVADDLKVSISAGIAGITKKMKSYSDMKHEAVIRLFEVKQNKR